MPSLTLNLSQTQGSIDTCPSGRIFDPLTCMNDAAIRSLCLMLGGMLITLGSLSCSTVTEGNGAKITKVKYFHLNPEIPLNTEERALQMERDYHLHGAVTRAQRQQRAGHYYSVFWKATDRATPLLLRFEYRQANAGLKTMSLDIPVDRIRRANVTRFQVTGDAYLELGPVTAWRVSLIRGQKELVAQESFLWK